MARPYTADWEAGFMGVQDWIDVNERRRSYLFTWHNFLAIEAGIASPQQARVPIRRLRPTRIPAASHLEARSDRLVRPAALVRAWLARCISWVICASVRTPLSA